MNRFFQTFTDGTSDAHGDRFILGTDYFRTYTGYILCCEHILEDCGLRGVRIKTDYLEVYFSGRAILKVPFQCDGPSSIMWDTPSAMRAAFWHDAFYKAMRDGKLRLQHKTAVDLLFYRMLVDDGCWKWRAKKACKAVSGLGYSSCMPEDETLYMVR